MWMWILFILFSVWKILKSSLRWRREKKSIYITLIPDDSNKYFSLKNILIGTFYDKVVCHEKRRAKREMEEKMKRLWKCRGTIETYFHWMCASNNVGMIFWPNRIFFFFLSLFHICSPFPLFFLLCTIA